jgi:hypothetical protein
MAKLNVRRNRTAKLGRRTKGHSMLKLNWDSIEDIELQYVVQDLQILFRFRVDTKGMSILRSVQTRSDDHTASWLTRSTFL